MSYKTDEEKKLKHLFKQGEISKEELAEELRQLHRQQNQAPSLRAKQINDFNSENSKRRYYDDD